MGEAGPTGWTRVRINNDRVKIDQSGGVLSIADESSS